MSIRAHAQARLPIYGSGRIAAIVVAAFLVAGCSSDKNTAPVTPGAITGKLTSSLGGPLVGAQVTVTPSGHAALDAVATDDSGSYTVNDVPKGTGNIVITGVPSNCAAPATIPYTIDRAGETITANVTATCTPVTGNLTVVISADSGVTPDVTVAYPDPCDFHSLTETTTLSDLQPGTYRVTAASKRTNGDIATRFDSATVTGSPVDLVAAASDSVTVTYSTWPAGSNALWVVNAGAATLAQYKPSQLLQSGTPQATATIGTGSVSLAAALDAEGRIWVSNFLDATVAAYSPAQLVGGGTPTPVVTLSGSALTDARGLVFDANGNLWVAERSLGTVIEYSASQLVDGGNVTPNITLSGTAFNGPAGLAFDDSGNLWVTNSWGGTVVELTPDQLTASSTPTPAVTISNSAILAPMGIAFDANGVMWLTNPSVPGNTIVGYTATQQNTGGNLAPAYTITMSGLPGPFGLTFDNSGDMWVANQLTNTLYEYTSSQTRAGGTPTPTVVISGVDVNGPEAVLLDPKRPPAP